jgi:hypothetical protein
MRRTTFLVSILVALVMLPVYLHGGTTGKLAGRIVDSETGEALVGVNVVLEGTKLGAATDFNGEFFVLQIPPASYTVRASAVGYRTMAFKNIQIKADQTTPLNIRLTAEAVVGEEIEVVAKRPIVETNVTSTIRTVTSEEIAVLPQTAKFQDVLAVQPGVVTTSPDKRDIHLRGGRTGEVLFIVDGVPIKNVLAGQATLDVPTEVIQEIQVQSGGYSAEYGNAQSGIVNIITKQGKEKYDGSLQIKSDDWGFMNQFDERYASLTFSGPEPITQKLLPMLNLNLPGRLTFFLGLDADQANTQYKFRNSPYTNFEKRRIELLGGLMGFDYADREYNSYTTDVTLRYSIGNYYINAGYRTSGRRTHDYDHAFAFRMDSTYINDQYSSHLTLRWNHTIDANTYYTIDFGRLESDAHLDVGGLTPPQYNWYWWGWDTNEDGFNELGNAILWRDNTTYTYTLRGDFTSQMFKHHELKFGLEASYDEIQWTDIQYPLFYPERVATARGPYPGYGVYRFILDNYPNTGSAYLTDKIEFEGINVQIGLRYDSFSPGKQVQDTAFVNAWKQAVGDSTFEPINWQGILSPRLAISHPISDKTVAFFNYGHFTQLPDRNLYFRDPWTATAWIGNPNLKPQRTVKYEFGFDHMFTDDIAVGVKGFYNDIFDLTGQAPVGGPGSGLYMFINLDYASSKGFEVTFKKRYRDYFGIDFSYVYMIAKGRSESPYALYYAEWNSGPGLLPREIRMAWDREHTVNLFFNYMVPPNTDYKIFGMPFFDDWGLTVRWTWGTGFPYTPPGRNSVYERNTATGPSYNNVDAKIEKRFKLFKDVRLEVFADVANLFDAENIHPSYVNTITGSANVYGDVGSVDNRVIIPWRTQDSRLDPRRLYPGRQVSLGFKLLLGSQMY